MDLSAGLTANTFDYTLQKYPVGAHPFAGLRCSTPHTL